MRKRGRSRRVASIDGDGSGAGAKLTVEIRRPGADPLVLAAEVTDARRAKIALPARAGNDAAPVTVRSPIPGRVVKLLVKADDAVKAGQTIVVLEAMKMENELRAPRAGARGSHPLRRGDHRRSRAGSRSTIA